MIPLYESVNHLDRRAVEVCAMSEELLMEHAALAMKEAILARFEAPCRVLIACGAGNNGADGLALARVLSTEPGFEPTVFLPMGVSSPLAKVQLSRVEALGLEQVEGLHPCEVLVDALFGSGFNRKMEEWASKLIRQMDELQAYKIACDLPSGISKEGNYDSCAQFDLTVTMGAPKLALFNDCIKDRAGEIMVANLGLPAMIYQEESDAYLLEMADLALPIRHRQDTHKGSYGHLAVLMGEKPGAALLSSMAALRFGAGLVSVITREHHVNVPFDLMQSRRVEEGMNALVLGMGLGESYIDEEIEEMIGARPVVLDADILYHTLTRRILEKGHPVVLTPHPKEFAALLKLCDLKQVSIEEVQANRLSLAKLFSEHYPEAVLVLKGANVIIAHNGWRYINPHGSSVLAKGGSGDVLSGMIGSLLAQGYAPQEAAIHASLAHALAASGYSGADYSMLPTELINQLANLQEGADRAQL
jgi:hydroxyethylthiazole kinase-like uncharacterized protein yjeF